MSVSHTERLLTGTANAYSRPKRDIGLLGGMRSQELEDSLVEEHVLQLIFDLAHRGASNPGLSDAPVGPAFRTVV